MNNRKRKWPSLIMAAALLAGLLPAVPASAGVTNTAALSGHRTADKVKMKDNEILTLSYTVTPTGEMLDRSAIDLGLVLDVSGSMGNPMTNNSTKTRLEALKEAAKLVTAKFAAAKAQNPANKDKVGLVTFDTSASLKQPLTNNFSSLDTVINALVKAGSTNIDYGLTLGADMVTSGSNPEKYLILLSDGAANYYYDDAKKQNVSSASLGKSEALKDAQTLAGKNIKVFTIAVVSPDRTDDVDIDLLQSIAKTTGGTYFQASDQTSLNNAFTTITENLQSNKMNNLVFKQKLPAGFALADGETGYTISDGYIVRNLSDIVYPVTNSSAQTFSVRLKYTGKVKQDTTFTFEPATVTYNVATAGKTLSIDDPLQITVCSSDAIPPLDPVVNGSFIKEYKTYLFDIDKNSLKDDPEGVGLTDNFELQKTYDLTGKKLVDSVTRPVSDPGTFYARKAEADAGSVKLILTDKNGNVNRYTVKAPVDENAPSISPADSTIRYTKANPTVTISATDAESYVYKLSVSVDGGTPVSSTVIDKTASVNVTISGSGNKTLQITAEDVNGNVATVTKYATTDETPPLDPVVEGSFIKEYKTYSFDIDKNSLKDDPEGTGLTDNFELQKTYDLAGKKVIDSVTRPVSDPGTFYAQKSETDAESVKLILTDKNGNVNNYTVKAPVDKNAPSISPTSSTIRYTKANPTVTISATDADSYVYKLSVSVDGGDPVSSTIIDKTASVNVPLSGSGKKKLEITAEDVNGNVATVTKYATSDETPPLDPVVEGSFTKEYKIYSYVIDKNSLKDDSEGNGLADTFELQKIYDQTGKKVVESTTRPVSNPGSFYARKSETDAQSVKLILTDLDDNVKQYTVQAPVDDTAPVIAPADESIRYKNENQTVTITATDADSYVYSLEVAVNEGDPIKSSVVDDKVSVDVPLSGFGWKKLVITAEDVNGNKVKVTKYILLAPDPSFTAKKTGGDYTISPTLSNAPVNVEIKDITASYEAYDASHPGHKLTSIKFATSTTISDPKDIPAASWKTWPKADGSGSIKISNSGNTYVHIRLTWSDGSIVEKMVLVQIDYNQKRY
ncbi:vWA domain-containing protein [Gorillibacterium massiliense]|uniref:vWA domain-containing protein n=1 Tax=Gorillibacterium massiliense TaxID=1280390 RepID=UPI0004B12CEA|nr:VWA domain-containing protein [Gorillibacterium massiliense]